MQGSMIAGLEKFERVLMSENEIQGILRAHQPDYRETLQARVDLYLSLSPALRTFQLELQKSALDVLKDIQQYAEAIKANQLIDTSLLVLHLQAFQDNILKMFASQGLSFEQTRSPMEWTAEILNGLRKDLVKASPLPILMTQYLQHTVNAAELELALYPKMVQHHSAAAAPPEPMLNDADDQCKEAIIAEDVERLRYQLQMASVMRPGLRYEAPQLHYQEALGDILDTHILLNVLDIMAKEKAAKQAGRPMEDKLKEDCLPALIYLSKARDPFSMALREVVISQAQSAASPEPQHPATRARARSQ